MANISKITPISASCAAIPASAMSRCKGSQRDPGKQIADERWYAKPDGYEPEGECQT